MNLFYMTSKINKYINTQTHFRNNRITDWAQIAANMQSDTEVYLLVVTNVKISDNNFTLRNSLHHCVNSSGIFTFRYLLY